MKINTSSCVIALAKASRRAYDIALAGIGRHLDSPLEAA
jgi:hypothetical protein